MKINLQTRLFPGYYGYNPMVSVSEYRAKKEEEAKKEAEEKAKQELIESLGKIKSFAIGTTPNFTIDLNPDMLTLDDIEQLTVTFGQFGRVVQRELLYFSDNYKYGFWQDSEGHYHPDAEIDVKDVFNDDPYIDYAYSSEYTEEGVVWHTTPKMRHRHQLIRNPKFTYNKIYNKLTLTLSQVDTLGRFEITEWNCTGKDSKGKRTYGDEQYYQGNPSLVMMEVKIKVRDRLHYHFPSQVVIRPQEYYAVAETIEHSLDGGRTMPIYTPHRFRLYYGDYYGPETEKFLPTRLGELDYHPELGYKGYRDQATAILCRDGLRVRSFPKFDSEGELSRFFCVMIPLHIKVKIKNIKILFGGSPGIMDHVDFDEEGRVIPTPIQYAEHLYDSEGNPMYDENGDPIFDIDSKGKTETLWYQSVYLIDPHGAVPENPMGEYICWYICAKDLITNLPSRFYGPSNQFDSEGQNAYYDFLINFEEVRPKYVVDDQAQSFYPPHV